MRPPDRLLLQGNPAPVFPDLHECRSMTMELLDGKAADSPQYGKFHQPRPPVEGSLRGGRFLFA
jgi:hypothetical protein